MSLFSLTARFLPILRIAMKPPEERAMFSINVVHLDMAVNSDIE